MRDKVKILEYTKANGDKFYKVKYVKRFLFFKILCDIVDHENYRGVRDGWSTKKVLNSIEEAREAIEWFNGNLDIIAYNKIVSIKEV